MRISPVSFKNFKLNNNKNTDSNKISFKSKETDEYWRSQLPDWMTQEEARYYTQKHQEDLVGILCDDDPQYKQRDIPLMAGWDGRPIYRRIISIANRSSECKAQRLINENPEMFVEKLGHLGENYADYVLRFKPLNGYYSVAQTLADKSPKCFCEAISRLSDKQKCRILTEYTNQKDTIAHNLAKSDAKSYVEATKDFPANKKYSILALKDDDYMTVAHYLAINDGESYLRATQDLSPDRKNELLSLWNRNGKTVAQCLAQKGSEYYIKAVEDLDIIQKIALATNQDNYGSTAGEKVHPSYTTELLNKFVNDKNAIKSYLESNLSIKPIDRAIIRNMANS